eukprot:41094_1
MTSSRRYTLRLVEFNDSEKNHCFVVNATTSWQEICQKYCDIFTLGKIKNCTFVYRILEHIDMNKTVAEVIDDLESYDENDEIRIIVLYDPCFVFLIDDGHGTYRTKATLTTRWMKIYQAYYRHKQTKLEVNNLIYRLIYNGNFINIKIHHHYVTIWDIIKNDYPAEEEINLDAEKMFDHDYPIAAALPVAVDESDKDVDMQDSKEFESPNNISIKCVVMRQANQILINCLQIPDEFLDSQRNLCYCDKCHRTRKDNEYYHRGKGKKKYVLPIGWSRIGLKVYIPKCKMNNTWEDWHVAYHGCSIETARNIFKSGLVLLKPGDSTINGEELKIKPGHIKGEVQRYNEYTMKNELFDPNQIFVTPSIRYASNEIYAKPFSIHDGCQKLKAQCVFQLRIRPGCYNIGQETIGATTAGTIIDKHIPNKELEWYTKEFLGIIIYGLLIRYWK